MTQSRALLPDLKSASPKDVLELARKLNVRFLRLQFTDILGVNKNVEIPALAVREGARRRHHVRRLVDRGVRPDRGVGHAARSRPRRRSGSSRGAIRTRASARLICDINTPDGDAVRRRSARRAQARRSRDAAALGYTMNAGMEAEFFLFKRGPNGEPTTETHDVGAYFDLAPVDLGEDARRAIVDDARADGLRGGGGAPRGGARPARDRLPLRRRADDGRQHRDVPLRREAAWRSSSGSSRRSCRSRSSGRTAAGCTRTSRCSGQGRTRSGTRRREWELSADGAALHRRAAAARARHVRDHQPAGELVQAAGAGLRGAGERRVVRCATARR